MTVRDARGDGGPRTSPDSDGLGPGADSDEADFLISTLIIGVLSQAFANEPDLEWGTGRFTPLFPKLMRLLVAVYPAPS